MGRIKGGKNIKKEDEGKKIKANIIRSNEGVSVVTNVVRTSLVFDGAQNLKAEDIVQHNRIMKIISITHYQDNSAKLELEIIKRSWSKKY